MLSSTTTVTQIVLNIFLLLQSGGIFASKNHEFRTLDTIHTSSNGQQLWPRKIVPSGTEHQNECGGLIHVKSTASTIEFSANGRKDVDCSWHIRAQSTHGNIVLGFDSLNITSEGVVASSDDVRTCTDTLEVRHSHMGQSGVNYCGTTIPSYSTLSLSNKMMLKLKTHGVSYSSFKVTVKWSSEEELCYNPRDKGLSYNGKVNYTQMLQPCLPWTKVTHCPHHAFNTQDAKKGLQGNYCRNPDNSQRPWCYVDADGCQSKHCDVCNTGIYKDTIDNCQRLKQEGFCTKDIANVTRFCAITCFETMFGLIPPLKTYKFDKCAAPRNQPIDGKPLTNVASKKAYMIGDVVEFVCNTDPSSGVKTTCLTGAQWSPIGPACKENKLCLDSLGTNRCLSLLEATPTMYREFREFSQANCKQTSGLCTTNDSTQECFDSLGTNRCLYQLKSTPTMCKEFREFSQARCKQTCGLCAAKNSTQSVCYDPKDRGVTYNGNVNETVSGAPCLSWEKVTKCSYHMFQSGLKIHNLDHNYCRNPDKGKYKQPFCYTDAHTCNFEYCNVCKINNIMSKNCKTPISPSDGKWVGKLKPIYHIGDEVIFKCSHVKGNDNKVTKVCLSNGRWSESGLACTECPPGFKKDKEWCVKYLDDHHSLDHRGSFQECEKHGAALPLPNSLKENQKLSSIMKNYNPTTKSERTWIWLGATAFVGHLFFSEYSGKPIVWNNWDRGYPKQSPSSCVIMDQSGMWRNVVCALPAIEMRLMCVSMPKPTSTTSKDYYHHSRCVHLLNGDNAMCQKFPEFATRFCAGTCKLTKACALPKFNKHTQVSTTKSMALPGERVRFSCDNHSIRVGGDDFIVCLMNGVLIRHPMQCTGLDDPSFVHYGIKDYQYLDKFVPANKIFIGINYLYTVKKSGQVVAWQFMSDISTTIHFQVWRRTSDPRLNIYQLIGENIVTVNSTQQTKGVYVVPDEERIDIAAGDFIGFLVTNQGSLRYTNCKITTDSSPGFASYVPISISTLGFGDRYRFRPSEMCVVFSFRAVVKNDIII